LPDQCKRGGTERCSLQRERMIVKGVARESRTCLVREALLGTRGKVKYMEWYYCTDGREGEQSSSL